jgi:hypothetical protein
MPFFNTSFYLLGTHKHILYGTLILMNFTYYNSLPGTDTRSQINFVVDFKPNSDTIKYLRRLSNS